jgi:hypothetical protein
MLTLLAMPLLCSSLLACSRGFKVIASLDDRPWVFGTLRCPEGMVSSTTSS